MVERHPVDIPVELTTVLDFAVPELVQCGHDIVLQQVFGHVRVTGDASQLGLQSRHVAKKRFMLLGVRVTAVG
jgi:hypothetical protein